METKITLAFSMRTVDDVIADWTIRQSGRTRWEGQEPRDDELILREITRPFPTWKHSERNTLSAP